MSILTLGTLPSIVLTGAQLADAGRLSLSAAGASPTLELSLDPGEADLPALLDPPPLRAPATLTRDDGTVFTGLVQAIRLGASPSITLES